MREPVRLGELVEDLLARLGVPDPDTWDSIVGEWAEVAGEPWASQARPRSLAEGVLTVEALSPAAVAVLRYGVTGLTRRLQERFGRGMIDEVRVRAPNPRSSG